MIVIHKYPFNIADRIEIPMHAGATVLHVAEQGGMSCLWAIVDTARPIVDHKFRIYGTGHEVDRSEHGVYVATWFAGPFVWHLFEA